MGEYYACPYFEVRLDNCSQMCLPFEAVLDSHRIVTFIENVVLPFKRFFIANVVLPFNRFFIASVVLPFKRFFIANVVLPFNRFFIANVVLPFKRFL